MRKFDQIKIKATRASVPLDWHPLLEYKPSKLILQRNTSQKSPPKPSPTRPNLNPRKDFKYLQKKLIPKPLFPHLPHKIKIELPSHPNLFRTDEIQKYIKNIKLIHPPELELQAKPPILKVTSAPKPTLSIPKRIEPQTRFEGASNLLLNNKPIKQYLSLGHLSKEQGYYESPLRLRVRIAMKIAGFLLFGFGLFELSKGFFQGFNLNRTLEFFTFAFVSFVLVYFGENFDLIVRADDDPYKLKKKKSDNPFDPVFP